MTKSEFNLVVADGERRRKDFMVVKIETEGSPQSEIIVNHADNFPMKKAYYDRAYDDNMRLIAAKDKVIRIVDVLMTSNLADLNWFAW